VYLEKEIRLAPLYDVISTIYYPELSTDMAMKIGREYSSAKVTPRDFGQLAEDAGLAKPLVRRRVPELAAAAQDALDKTKITGQVSSEVAALIRKRCECARDEFSSKVSCPHRLRRATHSVAPKRSLKIQSMSSASWSPRLRKSRGKALDRKAIVQAPRLNVRVVGIAKKQLPLFDRKIRATGFRLPDGRRNRTAKHLRIEFPRGQRTGMALGGLLGHWAVWTKRAVELLAECHSLTGEDRPIPARVLEKAAQSPIAMRHFLTPATSLPAALRVFTKCFGGKGSLKDFGASIRKRRSVPGSGKRSAVCTLPIPN
jgi:hypothetical protein